MMILFALWMRAVVFTSVSHKESFTWASDAASGAQCLNSAEHALHVLVVLYSKQSQVSWAKSSHLLQRHNLVALEVVLVARHADCAQPIVCCCCCRRLLVALLQLAHEIVRLVIRCRCWIDIVKSVKSLCMEVNLWLVFWFGCFEKKWKHKILSREESFAHVFVQSWENLIKLFYWSTSVAAAACWTLTSDYQTYSYWCWADIRIVIFFLYADLSLYSTWRLLLTIRLIQIMQRHSSLFCQQQLSLLLDALKSYSLKRKNLGKRDEFILCKRLKLKQYTHKHTNIRKKLSNLMSLANITDGSIRELELSQQ